MKLPRQSRPASAFTMVEIAISLAIIGFALVAIIGILPAGLTVQKENREETIINQDANYLMYAIRSGLRASNELPWFFERIVVSNEFAGTDLVWNNNNLLARPELVLGLLSTPTERIHNGNRWFTTNLVYANVRAISGAAVEKPPQADSGIQDLAFAYRLTVQVVPYTGFDTNSTNWTATSTPFYTNWLAARAMETNLYEVSLRFQWPLLPNGGVGPGRQTYRTLIGGTLMPTNITGVSQKLYFFNPRTYANLQ